MLRGLQLVFTPLLRISPAPLPPDWFPTKCCHSAAASNSEPEDGASRNITAPNYSLRYICKGEIKASLASGPTGRRWPLAWERVGRGGFEKVDGSSCSGPPAQTVWLLVINTHWVALQRSSCAEFQLIHWATQGGEREQGDVWQHCHLVLNVDYHNKGLLVILNNLMFHWLPVILITGHSTYFVSPW